MLEVTIQMTLNKLSYVTTKDERAWSPAEHKLVVLSSSPNSWAKGQILGINPSKLNMYVPSVWKNQWQALSGSKIWYEKFIKISKIDKSDAPDW